MAEAATWEGGNLNPVLNPWGTSSGRELIILRTRRPSPPYRWTDLLISRLGTPNQSFKTLTFSGSTAVRANQKA